MICVESVVNQQFPKLNEGNPKFRSFLIAFLRYLFHEREFKAFEESYPHLEGFDFLEQVLEYFDFGYNISDRERERIPTEGRVVIVANHPIGSLDALALLKLISTVRRDVKVVANEILMALDPLDPLLLPVNNMTGNTRKGCLQAIDRHLESDGAVVIFPAGEVSRFGPQGVRDGRWRTGFLRMAHKAKAPILPVFVDGKNSIFFYSLSALAKPLSALWLIHEMFKQAKKTMTIRIGHAIDHDIYSNLPGDLNSRAKRIKKHVYKLPKNKGIACFHVEVDSIAHPEDRQALRAEINQCELLGATRDHKQIYLYQHKADSSIMREIGRLRELSFRSVGEGSGLRRDIDKYDTYYDHIILWDDQDLELTGAYRMVRSGQLIEQEGDHKAAIDKLYSSTLFEYKEAAYPYLEQGLELGRSFVQPRYWGKRSLDYLWYGIGAYLRKYPEVRYMFGPVSISNSYPDAAKDLLVNFYSQHFSPSSDWACARTPYAREAKVVLDSSQHSQQQENPDYSQAFSDLRAKLGQMDATVPTLYKQYSEAYKDGGVQFVDFNVDTDFSDCIDGLVMADLGLLKDSKRKRYMGEDTSPNPNSKTGSNKAA